MSKCWDEIFLENYYVAYQFLQRHSKPTYNFDVSQVDAIETLWNEWKLILKSWISQVNSGKIPLLDILKFDGINASSKNSFAALKDVTFMKDVAFIGLNISSKNNLPIYNNVNNNVSLSQLCQLFRKFSTSFPKNENHSFLCNQLNLFNISLVLTLLQPMMAVLFITAAKETLPHRQYWSKIMNSSRYRLLLTCSYAPKFLLCHFLFYTRNLYFRFGKYENSYLKNNLYERDKLNSRCQYDFMRPSSIFFFSEPISKVSYLDHLYKEYGSKIGELMSLESIDMSNNPDSYMNYQRLFNSVCNLIDYLEAIIGIVPNSNHHLIDPRTAESLLAQLSRIIDAMKNFNSTFEERIKNCRKPSFIVRSWIPLSIGIFGCHTIFNMIHVNKKAIIGWLKESKDALYGLLTHWVRDPLLEIWRTVRYKSNKLAVIQTNSLSSDLKSLERMVTEFARLNPSLVNAQSSTDLNTVLERVRTGDLSLVLQKYEKEISSPIKNIVMGDLLTLILIQIQKSKVDLQIAMSALDQLLRSNELNFEFLAVIPTLVILYIMVIRTRGIWKSLWGLSKKKLLHQMQNILRDIHILLHGSSEELSKYDYGQLLIMSMTLLSVGHEIFNGKIKQKTWLCQDVSVLTGRRTSLSERKATLDRLLFSFPISFTSIGSC